MQEYLKRLALVWKSSLSGPCKVRATNSFCVSLLSYGFGVIPWTRKEVEQFQGKLTSTLSHHPRSAVERLYLLRGDVGRGLINIEHLFYTKLVAISQHLSVSTDPLVKLCYKLDRLLPPRTSVLSRGEVYCSTLSLPVDFVSGLPNRQAVCSKQMSMLKSLLISKPLHGKYIAFLQSDAVDRTSSVRWLP